MSLQIFKKIKWTLEESHLIILLSNIYIHLLILGKFNEALIYSKKLEKKI